MSLGFKGLIKESSLLRYGALFLGYLLLTSLRKFWIA